MGQVKWEKVGHNSFAIHFTSPITEPPLAPQFGYVNVTVSWNLNGAPSRQIWYWYSIDGSVTHGSFTTSQQMGSRTVYSGSEMVWIGTPVDAGCNMYS